MSGLGNWGFALVNECGGFKGIKNIYLRIANHASVLFPIRPVPEKCDKLC